MAAWLHGSVWPHEHSRGRWGGGRRVTRPCGVLRVPLSPEGPPLTNTTFPHIIPLVTLLERDEALTESPESWEATDNGVEVVMAHLEAARMVAHHGGLYHTNAEVKLQGKQWGQQSPFPSVTFPVCSSSTRMEHPTDARDPIPGN